MIMENGQEVNPKQGKFRWIRTPPNIDCVECWPRDGYGWKISGKEPKKSNSSTEDLEMCQTCQGTGIPPVPFSEFEIPWTAKDTQKWLKERKK